MPACSPPRSSPPRDEALAARLEAWRAAADRRRRRNARMIVPPGSTIGIVGGGQLGRMLAHGRRPARLSLPRLRARRGAARGRGRRRLHPRRRSTTRRRCAGSAARSTSPPTSSRISPPGRSPRSPAKVPLWPPREALEIAQDRLTEKAFIRDQGGRPAPFAAVDEPGGAERGAGRDRHAGDPEDAAASAMTARARCGSMRPSEAAAAWKAVRGAPCVLEGPDRVRRRILDPALPVVGRRGRALGRAAQRPQPRHPRPLDRAGRRRRSARPSPPPRRWRAASPTRSTMSA